MCSMCGGDLSPLCDSCLKELVGTMVESVLEQLVDQGKLDPVLQHAIEQRLARISVPSMDSDHSLVDVVSGEIRDG